jgi:hypothetical protein
MTVDAMQNVAGERRLVHRHRPAAFSQRSSSRGAFIRSAQAANAGVAPRQRSVSTFLTGFRVQQNNGLSSSQTVYHAHFHVIPSFGGKAPGTPAPRRKLPEAEYNEIAAKLRAAWPK